MWFVLAAVILHEQLIPKSLFGCMPIAAGALLMVLYIMMQFGGQDV